MVAVVSILDDKDAGGDAARGCCRACDAIVLHGQPKPRALPPRRSRRWRGQIARRRRRETVPEAHAALARARELAGHDGVVLVTGSIYLIADLLRRRGAPAGVDAVNDDDGPSGYW